MYLLRIDFIERKRTKSERKVLRDLAVKPLKGSETAEQRIPRKGLFFLSRKIKYTKKTGNKNAKILIEIDS